MVTTCWSCWSATDFGGLLSVIMEPPGSPSWMSSPPDQPLPNSPPLAPLAISGPQQRLGRRIGGGLGAGTRARTHVQVLCKLAMERRRLIVEGVMPPTVCGNQCRDGRRHLVFGRRQHAGLVALRREVADPRCWRLVSLWWPGRVVAHSGPGGVAPAVRRSSSSLRSASSPARLICAAPPHRFALHRHRRDSSAPLLLIASLCIVTGAHGQRRYTVGWTP